jgi:hypothetical protein
MMPDGKCASPITGTLGALGEMNLEFGGSGVHFEHL